jgi:hypothetical protein
MGVNYKARRQLLCRMVDTAEARGRKTCLLCRHFRLVESGQAARCRKHERNGIDLCRLKVGYWTTLESRAMFCLDLDTRA